jgi:hypothetical protein
MQGAALQKRQRAKANLFSQPMKIATISFQQFQSAMLVPPCPTKGCWDLTT